MSALLEVEGLEVSFGGRTAAVRGASFRVEKGETHCLVGESGCGKSVTALAVMSLLARGGQRSANKMSFAGTELTAPVVSGLGASSPSFPHPPHSRWALTSNASSYACVPAKQGPVSWIARGTRARMLSLDSCYRG